VKISKMDKKVITKLYERNILKDKLDYIKENLMPLVKTCNNNHVEISYEIFALEDFCPLCEANNTIKNQQYIIGELRSERDYLERKI
jgi:hypothetical protein